MLVTALDARVRLGTHEDHRITFANMAFTDDPGVQRQAAAESAANIAKDLGIALAEKYSRQVAGHKLVALFLISSPTIFTWFTARKTRRCSHMPLGVEESAIQRDAFRYRCVISNDMSSSI